MPDIAIFIIGVFVTALCLGFMIFTFLEVRRQTDWKTEPKPPSDEPWRG